MITFGIRFSPWHLRSLGSLCATGFCRASEQLVTSTQVSLAYSVSACAGRKVLAWVSSSGEWVYAV